MNLSTEEGISDALREIASWSSPAAAIDRDEVQSLVAVDRSVPRYRLRSRAVLIVASLVISAGVIGLLTDRPQPNVVTSDNLGAGLTRSTAVELCLDVDSDYGLDQLRSTGRLHNFSKPNTGERALVLSTNSLHAACGLAQRQNGEWFRVVSVVNAQLPLSASDGVSVVETVRLQDRIYVTGQIGAQIKTLDVTTPSNRYAGQIDNGWWGVSFEAEGDLTEAFPDFVVSWTTATGGSGSAPGADLRASQEWLVCAQDDECRRHRLAELNELARGLEAPEQATILEDGTVTADEYRAVLRTWGSCIAESTGTTLTYDEDGLFTVPGTSDSISEAFESCQEMHASIVIEVASLQGQP